MEYFVNGVTGHKKVIAWLEENVGEKNIDWIYTYDVRGGIPIPHVSFLREEDKAFFILKWL